jgi:hypothetical protein
MGRRVYGATWTPQRGIHADPTPRRNVVRGSSRLRFVDGELVFVAGYGRSEHEAIEVVEQALRAEGRFTGEPIGSDARGVPTDADEREAETLARVG